MNVLPLLIKEIKQKDRYHFFITWMDDKTSLYHLAHLQRNCPCTRCRDDKTGEFIKNQQEISDTILAKKIVSIGNYALRIEFSKGCQSGIYTYSFLRKLACLQNEEGLL